MKISAERGLSTLILWLADEYAGNAALAVTAKTASEACDYHNARNEAKRLLERLLADAEERGQIKDADEDELPPGAFTRALRGGVIAGDLAAAVRLMERGHPLGDIYERAFLLGPRQH